MGVPDQPLPAVPESVMDEVPAQPVPAPPESAETPIAEETQPSNDSAVATVPNVPTDEALRALFREGIEAFAQEAATVHQLFELHNSRMEQRRKEEVELQERRRS